jgi:L-rhamnonate dehydratase
VQITAVRCFQLSGRSDHPSNEERQSQMLDIYPEFAARGVTTRTPGGIHKATYVEIDTDEGISGIFGPIFDEQVPLIKVRLAPYLIGRDPLAGEFLWDVMYRQDRHARKGYQMLALSALDCALWDLPPARRPHARPRPLLRLDARPFARPRPHPRACPGDRRSGF